MNRFARFRSIRRRLSLPGEARRELSVRRPAFDGRKPGFTMKLATYNIHSCIDTVWSLDMEKTAEVIAATGADVVALQEVDANKPRTGGVFQAEWLADRLEMDFRYFPVIRSGEEKYGLAVLSVLPMKEVKFGRLPVLEMRKPREVRGAMWIRLETEQGPVNLVNTHLGLKMAERRLQIEALLGGAWLGAVAEEEPTVFCGDFNAGRRSYVYRSVCRRFSDVQRMPGSQRPPRATFLSYYPVLCLDHIFVSHHFSVVKAEVPASRIARRASDHLPVVAELALDPKRQPLKK